MWLHSLKVAQLLRSAACLHTNQSRSYLKHLVLSYIKDSQCLTDGVVRRPSYVHTFIYNISTMSDGLYIYIFSPTPDTLCLKDGVESQAASNHTFTGKSLSESRRWRLSTDSFQYVHAFTYKVRLICDRLYSSDGVTKDLRCETTRHKSLKLYKGQLYCNIASKS